MMIKQTIIAIASIAIMAPTFALANEQHKAGAISYSGPVETVTVAELLEDTGMLTERNAVVDGRIIKQIDAETFIFTDGSKEIQIELDDDIRLPQAIDENTKVRLFGEYEGGITPEIEVEHLQLL